MRSILAILAFGLFSLTSVAQNDYQMCGTANGVEVCLTMDTSNRTANIVACPLNATQASDCLIFLGTFTATGSGLSTVITFINSADGTRTNFYHQGYDLYRLTADGEVWTLHLKAL